MLRQCFQTRRVHIWAFYCAVRIIYGNTCWTNRSHVRWSKAWSRNTHAVKSCHDHDVPGASLRHDNTPIAVTLGRQMIDMANAWLT